MVKKFLCLRDAYIFPFGIFLIVFMSIISIYISNSILVFGYSPGLRSHGAAGNTYLGSPDWPMTLVASDSTTVFDSVTTSSYLQT